VGKRGLLIVAKNKFKDEFALQRPDIAPDFDTVNSYVRGRKVLVTGAGGSIGSELCRQLIDCELESLLLLGRGENSIFEIHRELLERESRIELETIIADVRDRPRMERVFREYIPQVVFHTAAHKHVHLMERHPAEAVKNNVIGTANIAQIALATGVETFVLISSDKAINPTNVYGATKKIAEYIVRDLAEDGATKFVVVRFGNVIRSRGSIIPIFERQIRNGGPITITHPEMERFFMSIPEAAYLVLQSAGIAESGQICVLDMGNSIRIVELANWLIKEAGLEPGKDIQIAFTGIRPGEKIVEELVHAENKLECTPWEKIMLDQTDGVDSSNLHEELDQLTHNIDRYERGEIIKCLQRIVPTYVPLTDKV